MPPQIIFPIHLVLGYVAWLILLRRLYPAPAPLNDAARSPPRHRHPAQLPLLRARLHPSRSRRPSALNFATFAAYGDFATGLLALLALATVRVRPLFWSFVVAFNLVGVADILLDYFHAIRAGLPAIAGQMGAAYFIPILYVPLLMITSFVALYWLLRTLPRTAHKSPLS